MPDAISSTKSYLVVDGFINTQGVTSITLSRTYDISAKTLPPVETGSTVWIEEEGGQRYSLHEGSTKGTYTSASLVLNAAKNYRLSIRTAAGKEYVSDYVPVRTTPLIDDVTWQATDTGLSIYVNTHDDTKAAQYYRWDYEETWEISPLLRPDIEYLNSSIREIKTPYPITCWLNEKSTSIFLSNTIRLQRDVISNYLLRSLPNTTERLRHKYSILVRQHAQTQQEYAYWELLKKNTENIGTLFDPLPAQLTGNVHCLNDDAELALGYISAHSVQEKRLFISRAQWPLVSGYDNCVPQDTLPRRLASATFGNGYLVPIITIYDMMGEIFGYTYTSLDCVDCRRRGTATRPSFWQ